MGILGAIFASQNCFLSSQGQVSVLAAAEGREELLRLIMMGKLELALLAKVSSGHAGDIFHGESAGNFFTMAQFRLVVRNHVERLFEAGDLLQRLNDQRQVIKDVAGLQAIFLAKAFRQDPTAPESDGKHACDVDSGNGEVDAPIDCSAIPVQKGLPEGTVFLPKISVGRPLSVQASRAIPSVPACSPISNPFAGACRQLMAIDAQVQQLRELELYYHAGQILPRMGAKWKCPSCPSFPGVLCGQWTCPNQSCHHYPSLLAYCGSLSRSLFELFCEQEGLSAQGGMVRLAARLNLDIEQPFAPTPEGSRAGWHMVKHRPSINAGINSPLIPFLSLRNTILGFAEIRVLGESKITLPRTLWACGSSSRVLELHVPFDTPQPLLNLNRILLNPSAPVWLTDSVEFAWYKTMLPDDSGIWTSWIGGLEAIEYIDWNALSGRKVNYQFSQRAGIPEEQASKIAIAAMLRAKQAGAHVGEISGLGL